MTWGKNCCFWAMGNIHARFSSHPTNDCISPDYFFKVTSCGQLYYCMPSLSWGISEFHRSNEPSFSGTAVSITLRFRAYAHDLSWRGRFIFADLVRRLTFT